MIAFNEAKKIVKSHLFQLGYETVDLNESGGRILAEDVTATMPSPRFDNSAMDGYALRAVDTKGASKENPVSLKMVSISSAGSPANAEIGPGECIQCMTGATIPKGADAVVMVEDTSGFSDSAIIKIFLEAHVGKHIRKKGEEISEGHILIPKGTSVTAAEIGTFAMFGYEKLIVSQKPKIAIFGTGDELVEPGNNLKSGQIYNSNLFVFADLAEKAGVEVIIRDVLKDEKDSLQQFLSRALSTSNVVISSGGVSMGRYDFIRDVFIELGVEEHFWKVAQKPGKPLFFGTGQDTLIFGLPGNPVSSYIGFMEWVWPALEYMMGKKSSKLFSGTLTESFPRESVKKRFLFGYAWIKNGELLCRPTSKVGSHMLTSTLGANSILCAEPGDGILNAGDKIIVNVLPWKNIS